jgi:hypothetical protein
LLRAGTAQARAACRRRSSCALDRKGFIRVALDDTGHQVLGWIGGLPENDGNVRE